MNKADDTFPQPPLDDDETEASTEIAEAVPAQQHRHPRVALKLTLLTLFLLAIVGLGVSLGVRRNNNNEKNTSAALSSPTSSTASTDPVASQDEMPQQIQVEDILPFVQVRIVEETNTRAQGNMQVNIENRREFFTFQSERDKNTMTISMQCDKTLASKNDEMDGWCGIEWIVDSSSNDMKIRLTRYDDDDDEDIILTISEDETDEDVDKTIQSTLESFIGSKLAEYYIALTFKLAAMGKTGANNPVFAQMHSQAQWIFEVAVGDDAVNQSLHWDLGTSRRGLHETAIVDDLNFLLASDQMVPEDIAEANPEMAWLPVDHHRQLGSCGSPYSRCGNACYGMCGPGCTCWSWACGGCGCYDGCRSHDYYCSCRGWWHPWCILAVWALVC